MEKMRIRGELLLVKWDEISNIEKNELIAIKVLEWTKKENGWYAINQQQKEEGPFPLPHFATDPSSLLIILEKFESYQITKMFPPKYRTIIQANKNVAYSESINDSICRAALIAIGMDFN